MLLKKKTNWSFKDSYRENYICCYMLVFSVLSKNEVIIQVPNFMRNFLQIKIILKIVKANPKN